MTFGTHFISCLKRFMLTASAGNAGTSNKNMNEAELDWRAERWISALEELTKRIKIKFKKNIMKCHLVTGRTIRPRPSDEPKIAEGRLICTAKSPCSVYSLDNRTEATSANGSQGEFAYQIDWDLIIWPDWQNMCSVRVQYCRRAIFACDCQNWFIVQQLGPNQCRMNMRVSEMTGENSRILWDGPTACRVYSSLSLVTLAKGCCLLRHNKFGSVQVARRTKAMILYYTDCLISI